MKKSEPTTRVMPITFEGQPEKPIALRAYLFDQEGKLLQTVDVKDNEARFTAAFHTIRDVRVLIAPADEANLRIETASDLSRYKPYEPIFNIADKGILQTLPIPQRYWCRWVRKHCRVTGTVKKMFDISGFLEAKSICDVRVHICEVDRIPWIIWRIPDYIIDKVRHELLTQPPIPH